MEHIAEKIRDLIVNAGEQFIVASVQGFHAIVFALLTVPECICSATSLSQLAWDQVSSPGPHAPAGDLTLHLIKIWMNHVVEVVVPQVKRAVALLRGTRLSVSKLGFLRQDQSLSFLGFPSPDLPSDGPAPTSTPLMSMLSMTARPGIPPAVSVPSSKIIEMLFIVAPTASGGKN